MHHVEITRMVCLYWQCLSAFSTPDDNINIRIQDYVAQICPKNMQVNLKVYNSKTFEGVVSTQLLLNWISNESSTFMHKQWV